MIYLKLLKLFLKIENGPFRVEVEGEEDLASLIVFFFT